MSVDVWVCSAMHICVCVGNRSSTSLSTSVLETRSLPYLELSVWARLTGRPAPRTYPSLT